MVYDVCGSLDLSSNPFDLPYRCNGRSRSVVVSVVIAVVIIVVATIVSIIVIIAAVV